MKITLIAAISADGKIAERTDQSSMDWTSPEDTKFFVEKTKEAGTVVMGRKTFATINKGLKGRRVIVMTSDPGNATAIEGVEYTSESVVELVRRLESEGCTALALAGGSSVYGQFLQASLVTDVYLTIEPVLFGGGVPLAEGFDRIPMKLESITQLNPQTLVLHYTL
jgi:dihydrofolate reductase